MKKWCKSDALVPSSDALVTNSFLLLLARHLLLLGFCLGQKRLLRLHDWQKRDGTKEACQLVSCTL